MKNLKFVVTKCNVMGFKVNFADGYGRCSRHTENKQGF